VPTHGLGRLRGESPALIMHGRSHLPLPTSHPACMSSSAAQALVLAPTRELALQIQAEAARFGGSSRIKTSAVYGGVPKQQQVSPCRSYGCGSVVHHLCMTDGGML
jgi:superfamily II DNA/RNA helicase